MRRAKKTPVQTMEDDTPRLLFFSCSLRDPSRLCLLSYRTSQLYSLPTHVLICASSCGFLPAIRLLWGFYQPFPREWCSRHSIRRIEGRELSHCRILAQYFRRSRFLNINTLPLLPFSIDSNRSGPLNFAIGKCRSCLAKEEEEIVEPQEGVTGY